MCFVILSITGWWMTGDNVQVIFCSKTNLSSSNTKKKYNQIYLIMCLCRMLKNKKCQRRPQKYSISWTTWCWITSLLLPPHSAFSTLCVTGPWPPAVGLQLGWGGGWGWGWRLNGSTKSCCFSGWHRPESEHSAVLSVNSINPRNHRVNERASERALPPKLRPHTDSVYSLTPDLL